MKRLLSTFFACATILSLCSCNNDKEGLKFLETNAFTEATFRKAIKDYGHDNTRYDFVKQVDVPYKELTQEQAEAAYKNPSVKVLLTSEYYTYLHEADLYATKIWNLYAKDMFTNQITYSYNSLWQIFDDKFGCYYLKGFVSPIGDVIDTMAANASVKNIMKNQGVEFYRETYSNKHELDLSYFLELSKKTDSWYFNNANIVAHPFNNGAPIGMITSEWKYKHYDFYDPEESKYPGLENRVIYKQLLYQIKAHLLDPFSLVLDGEINFHTTTNSIEDSRYKELIYVHVPFRAKNSYGAYIHDECWLTYDYNKQIFCYYAPYAPLSIYPTPFNTEHVPVEY